MLDAESNPEQIANAMLEALPAPLHCCPTGHERSMVCSKIARICLRFFRKPDRAAAANQQVSATE